MPIQQGKKAISVTIDRVVIRIMDDQTDNRSDYVNKALIEYQNNSDELYKQKLKDEIAECQTKLEKIEAKEKQTKIEEEAKQKELESQKAEALKEIDALNLTGLSDSWVSDSISSEVQKIASKYGWNWEKNPTEMSVLMNRALDRKAEERITGE